MWFCYTACPGVRNFDMAMIDYAGKRKDML